MTYEQKVIRKTFSIFLEMATPDKSKYDKEEQAYYQVYSIKTPTYIARRQMSPTRSDFIIIKRLGYALGEYTAINIKTLAVTNYDEVEAFMFECVKMRVNAKKGEKELIKINVKICN